MTPIPKEVFLKYRALLAALENATNKQVFAMLAGYKNVEEVLANKDAIYSAYYNIVLTNSRAGIYTSRDFFEMAREASLETEIPKIRSPQVIDKDTAAHVVDGFIKNAEKDGIFASTKALAFSAGNFIKKLSHKTVSMNSYSFARVPMGAYTCAFCIMLASRGAVYHSAASAGEMNKFHHHCNCLVVPGFLLKRVSKDIYNPDLYYRRYLECFHWDNAGSSGVLAEMRKRDPRWFVEENYTDTRLEALQKMGATSSQLAEAKDKLQHGFEYKLM